MSTNKKKIWVVLLSFFSLFAILITLIVILICRENDDYSNENNVIGNTSGTQQTMADEDETPGNDQVTESNKADMTIMVYMIGSNLEREYGYATRDITKLVNAKFDDNVNVAVQAGGVSQWQNTMFEGGATYRFSIRDEKLYDMTNMGSVNMASEKTLSDFIKYAESNYPADNYTLILWNHGGNIPINYGIDEMFPRENITYAELKDGLAEAGVHFDTIVFNACLMSTLEVALSVMDYADYMVAAETVITDGLDFTNWLASIKKDPNANPEIHHKILMEDYMAMLERNGWEGTISMLDLDKIDEVYDEYVKYAKEVSEELRDKGYEKYFGVRNSGGYYTNTDSVDIITMATYYKTDASEDLIDAVEEAVLYSYSDYEYANGLATYSPHEYINYYSDGRQAMVDIGYDEAVLDYLDVYSSITLAYTGADNVNKYGGNWYDVAAVEAHMGQNVQTGPTRYELATLDKNGQTVIRFSENDKKVIKMIYATLMEEIENGVYIMYGADSYSNFDQDGDLVVDLPQKWITINDYLACAILINKYKNEQTGSVGEVYGIHAKRNGEDILIIVSYTTECPTGRILGFVNYDYEKGYDDSYIYPFKEDDVINLIHCIIYESGTSGRREYTQLVADDFLALNLVLNYKEINYENIKASSYIEVVDIYGNKYYTLMKKYY